MASLMKVFYGVCATALLVLIALFIRKDTFLLFDPDFHGFMVIPNDPYPHSGKAGFQVYTSGCQIPEFDPFDPSVRSLILHVGKLVCGGPPPLLTANRTHLAINWTNVHKYFRGNEAECNFRRIWRKDDGKSDDKYAMEGTGQPITDVLRIRDEFMYIECFSTKDAPVFRDYMAFIKEKADLEERCKKRHQQWVQESQSYVQERLNLVIVGIDSVSRLNMLRYMPKTYNFLRNVIGAIDLHGFNKVADNTFLNVVPLLSGLYVEECWNETLRHQPFDNVTLLWKDFSLKGYRTLFAEDAPDISTFNYLKAGFHHQPTDYYLRPFNLATERSLMRKNSRHHCFYSRPEASVTLTWLADFVETFKDRPNFSYLFNSRLTHDYLHFTSYADLPYYQFFTRIHESGVFNNSVVVFFSDHGIRFGKIRDTYIGKLEERLPFFLLAFPPWFSKKYPHLWRNLRINEHRLTTPFDLYETFWDVLNFTGEARPANISQRGISLFSEIPEERTCEDATILPHWCTCHVRKLVSPKDEHVRQAARQLITIMNDRLQPYTNLCSELRLDNVTDARVSSISDNILRFKASVKEVIGRKVAYGHRLAGVSDYLLTVQVTPGGGIFEGTVRFFESGSKYRVMGDISRTNLYGNQSLCISEPSVRKFCYCL